MAASRRADPLKGETLGAYLKRSRESAGLSQDELVRRTGLSLSTIRKIEDGRTANPGIFTLIKVWQALNLLPGPLINLIERDVKRQRSGARLQGQRGMREPRRAGTGR